MKLGLRTNIPIVRQGLENFTSDVPKIGRLRLFRLSQRVVVRLKKVPPELPHQRYKRTGHMVAAWQISQLPDGYTIINDVRNKRGKRYAQFPHGNASGQKQSRIHIGRWLNFRATVDDEVRKLPPEVVAALSASIRKNLPKSTI